jgi:hypothetical protein
MYGEVALDHWRSCLCWWSSSGASKKYCVCVNIQWRKWPMRMTGHSIHASTKRWKDDGFTLLHKNRARVCSSSTVRLYSS